MFGVMWPHGALTMEIDADVLGRALGGNRILGTRGDVAPKTPFAFVLEQATCTPPRSLEVSPRFWP